MTSERQQRQIDALLDEAEAAIRAEDWPMVRQRVRSVLALDPANVDALAYSEAAERAEGSSVSGPESTTATGSSPPSSEAQPTSFATGRYEVKRFLGEGGKKRVYLAHDAQLDRDVAFALIKTEGLDDAARQRITREAQAMGRLGSHPHIVTVYDIGEENGQPYLVLPVLPGGDVEGVIENAPDHKLPIEQAVKIATETCMGLEFSHQKGIIHRDLKPGNVWLAEDGRAMIGDFGLAVAVDRSRLTQAGMMVGTVNYMPPEQAMGGEVTPQSDLYSLGCMLYEMVCGRPPFVGDEHVAIIGQHLNTPPVAPTWHRPDCPAGLEALILRLLEKDASKRPASAEEVRVALRSVDEEPAQAPHSDEAAAPAYDPLYRRTFVGRENETRQLHEAYDAAVSGQGGLVMVAGEPGIGKTALCEQLATYVSMRGGKWLVGHSYEEGSLSLPYLAFVEAMRSYVLDRDPEALKTELGSGAGEVARLVSEVKDRFSVELRDAGDPEDDRWRLLNAITTFLRNAAAVQPLVIVLEDLHWSDRGTLDLLLHVARNLAGTRLLVVGTYRDVEIDRAHPLSATLADLRRINTFLRIPLRGLTVDEVHRMYKAIRGDDDVPWSMAETVHRQTEGNPLFVQEVLRYLVEEGVVVREDGRYVTQEHAVAAVPEGLRDVVGRRIGHLDQKTNDVLSIASVIGRDFGLDVLQRVADLPEADLEAALEEATERSVIEQRRSPGAVGFRFTHAFFRQVLYEEIFAPRRIRWHQEVARALEEVYAQRLDDHAAELAEHFAQSVDPGDLTKAISYGELAAQRAFSVFAHGEAAHHLEQALRAQDVLDPNEKSKRCDLLLALGGSFHALGEYERALDEVAPAAFGLAEELKDDKRALAACILAQNSTVGRVSHVSDHWLEIAYRYVGDDLTGRIRLNRRKARQLIQTGHATVGRELFRENLDLARSVNSPEAEFSALWAVLGLPLQEVMPLVSEFATRSREGVSTQTLDVTLFIMAHAFWANGQRKQGDDLALEAATLAEQRTTAHAQDMSTVLLRSRAILDGRFAQLPAFGPERINAINSIGNLIPGLISEIGKYSESTQWLVLERSDDTLTGRIVSALSLSRVDDLMSARAGFPALISEITEVGQEAPSSLLGFLLELALVLEDATAQDHILAMLRSRELTLHSLSLWDFYPRPYFRLMGDAAVILGHPEEARGYFEQSLVVCERIGHRPELALTRAHLAELLLDHYPDEHAAAIEHLDFVIAEFQEMKMQPALERALGRRGLLKA